MSYSAKKIVLLCLYYKLNNSCGRMSVVLFNAKMTELIVMKVGILIRWRSSITRKLNFIPTSPRDRKLCG